MANETTAFNLIKKIDSNWNDSHDFDDLIADEEDELLLDSVEVLDDPFAAAVASIVLDVSDTYSDSLSADTLEEIKESLEIGIIKLKSAIESIDSVIESLEDNDESD